MAAIAVVFSHLHGVLFAHHVILDLTPLRILWAGGEAVILFFVLSGFVLSAPVCEPGTFQFGPFFLGRLTRIYIPYIAAIAFCLLLAEVALRFPPHDLKAVATEPWPSPIDWGLVASHVGLVGNFNTLAFDRVIWSLVHEMRYSIVFPIYLWMLRTLSWKTCLLAAGAMSVGAALVAAGGLDSSEGFRNSYTYTAHYLLFFMLGGLLAKNFLAIASVISNLTVVRAKIAFGIALGLYAYATVVFHSLPALMNWPLTAQFGNFLADWAVGIGALFLIVVAIERGESARLLRSRPLLFAGKVSYSLYLIHLPVLSATIYWCGDLPKILALLISLPVICVATAAFYYCVEAPCHRLGRAIMAKLAMDSRSSVRIVMKDT